MHFARLSRLAVLDKSTGIMPLFFSLFFFSLLMFEPELLKPPARGAASGFIRNS